MPWVFCPNLRIGDSRPVVAYDVTQRSFYVLCLCIESRRPKCCYSDFYNYLLYVSIFTVNYRV